ncbi:hypothetical protein [Zhenhengia yiwuensis]|uniref:Uncharacterized protein n=1 Tax=Zhenhengia yiwuensis TaxID=2763666 RepID=A0A926IGL4_9FIRM|nr:hypothetical protein [Zhenhengia yiwuensis]MBC8581646.1 hypothetical protein [Zhenhengia yiwuensis]
MCEKRVMVHFDEANLDLHRYVSKHRNKSDFIRECIRYRMEKEKDLKEVVMEAIKEVLGSGTISLVQPTDVDPVKVIDEGMKEVADFFEEY